MTRKDYLKRRTKIVCTIGPATGTAAVIESLVKSGMNIARLNLSHGTYDVHSRYIQSIRRISQRLEIPVAVIIDLPGPKYRIGKIKDGQIFLKRSAPVTLTTRDITGDESVLPVNLPSLPQDVKKGDTILLDDGALQLKVLGRDGSEVKTRVTEGGTLIENRGLVVPGMRTSVPFISDTLLEHIAFAVRQKPDYLAISFVSKAEDVLGVKEVLRKNDADIPIISKIERVQAVREFDEILSASDGIMVARGDLGVDIPLERVPLIQKEIIGKCNRAGKPVITATQMLESMINVARPTRAEVTDVANAIFDGTDATMLSAETSIGKHPVQAVKTMSRIALETEKVLPYANMLAERRAWIERETDELISYSACHTADSLGAVAIVAFTQSGSTARRVSKYRPQVPVAALVPDSTISGRLLLFRGVYPFQIEEVQSVDGLFNAAIKVTRESRLARSGDIIVITGGVPIGVVGSTNMLKVEKLA